MATMTPKNSSKFMHKLNPKEVSPWRLFAPMKESGLLESPQR